MWAGTSMPAHRREKKEGEDAFLLATTNPGEEGRGEQGHFSLLQPGKRKKKKKVAAALPIVAPWVMRGRRT